LDWLRYWNRWRRDRTFVTIPGTGYAARLDENVGALNVKLSPEDVARISAAVRAGAAARTQYPAGGMAGVFI
jgi:aryl-alcohol dehydrogenase-like predicted oxidoreductase